MKKMMKCKGNFWWKRKSFYSSNVVHNSHFFTKDFPKVKAFCFFMLCFQVFVQPL